MSFSTTVTYSPEITKLISEGSRAYSSKDYDLASEKYGEACEKYSGEHEGSEDADLLFLYGKAIFQSAVSKSEVFGGAGASASKTNGDSDAEGDEEGEAEKDEDDQFQFYDAEPIEGDNEEDEQGSEEDGDEGPQMAEEDDEDDEPETTKGDDNKNEGQDEEEQSEFEIAWEILDLTRNLLEEKLEGLNKGDLTPPYILDKNASITNEYVVVLQKLSEVYDILGEVSLETENFPQAAIDLKKCLDLRLELYKSSNSLISESHYKLALALEFCGDDSESKSKAQEQIKLAIDSVKARNQDETNEDRTKDNEEMIQELEAKYVDLGNDELKAQADMIKGLLGQVTSEASSGPQEGSSSATAINNLTSMVKKKTKDAKVNDLTGMVKKRKAPKKDPSEANKKVKTD
ncbi:uncharacterized protein J8A68_005738 [[Candida] subhashii]|uniref:Tetratricopeptide SHNi-TPR domain-containing protein n=1 Tax=[Candida] subhashii TaxID=561895 RepID=A0A8J5QGI9_9ASCO|nr:uncharacterized protein J8A68_005738 [[Candida] subhashii]KAG7660776.1 hypothetical protein J8A68_005738 [[Candida] subhashii]